MKIGLGLYRHQLNREHYDFARQCGATHLVVHLVDYFRQGEHNPSNNQPTGGSAGWGRAGDPNRLWTVEELALLKHEINAAGLELEAIENFDPAHWHDVLLAGPKKAEQIENLKTIVRRLGEVGVPVMGYNFSIAGVAGRTTGRFARGNAASVGMDRTDDTPVPLGMVWNMVYDPDAPPGILPEIGEDELWRRLRDFLKAILPVAEEAGVTLAAHPDDPPVPRLRRQPRLVYQPHMYQGLIDIDPSPANMLEFCIGTLAEMTGGDLYDAVEQYSRQGRIAYVHLRNIAGKAPHYRETFIDDGEVDIPRVLSILQRNGFDGVVIPDHTPQMTCQAPWHAGMAHALGFIEGLLKRL